MKIKTDVKAGAGGMTYEPPRGRNHNQRGLAVRPPRKARPNHGPGRSGGPRS